MSQYADIEVIFILVANMCCGVVHRNFAMHCKYFRHYLGTKGDDRVSIWITRAKWLVLISGDFAFEVSTTLLTISEL
jgi:hypothetical protein